MPTTPDPQRSERLLVFQMISTTSAHPPFFPLDRTWERRLDCGPASRKRKLLTERSELRKQSAARMHRPIMSLATNPSDGRSPPLRLRECPYRVGNRRPISLAAGAPSISTQSVLVSAARSASRGHRQG